MKSWRFFFCLLADGTYMFVKENVAKKGKSFRPTFSDTGYFMKPGQGVAKLSYSQHHLIESLWSFPEHLKLIKAQTFWQMKCRWFGERLFIIWWIISGQFCQQNVQLHLLQLAEFPPTGRNEQNSQPWAKFLVTLSKFSSCTARTRFPRLHGRFRYASLLLAAPYSLFDFWWKFVFPTFLLREQHAWRKSWKITEVSDFPCIVFLPACLYALRIAKQLFGQFFNNGDEKKSILLLASTEPMSTEETKQT